MLKISHISVFVPILLKSWNLEGLRVTWHAIEWGTFFFFVNQCGRGQDSLTFSPLCGFKINAAYTSRYATK